MLLDVGVCSFRSTPRNNGSFNSSEFFCLFNFFFFKLGLGRGIPHRSVGALCSARPAHPMGRDCVGDYLESG